MSASATNLLFISFFFFLLASCASAGGGDDNYPCLQKLLPCAAYLKGSNPPPTCCIPLKDAVEKDANCLCELFNNQEILKNFNVTQDEALELPKRCGANADLGKCKAHNGGKDAPPPSKPTPSTPTPPSNSSETPASSSPRSGGLGAIGAAAMLVANGVIYLTMSS